MCQLTVKPVEVLDFCKQCVKRSLAPWRALELALEQVLLYMLSLMRPKT